ncbi:MAG: helix-turn-helix transcriptional regulator [Demequinaceae bacterium]|nr:helix-turn-helix transcriptional regulator [Demequinaceae bacterium]
MVIELTTSGGALASESAAVDLLAAATEPTRWRILATLASAGTRCACEIEPVADVAPNVLSYHLKVLREAGLVTSARRGKWIDYTIADDAAERLANALPTVFAVASSAGAEGSCVVPLQMAEVAR